MFENITDSDVMVYLRNTILVLSHLAEEKQVTIDIRCEKEGGYGYAQAGARGSAL